MKILYRALIVWGISLGMGNTAYAQTEKIEVEKSIHNLFQGMREGDSTLVHSVFFDEVRMFSVFTDKNGKEVINPGSLGKFLTAIGTPHDEVWDERIWNLSIDVDDQLAHAWMDYAFYAGNRFSHCGVNAMQLVQQNGKWKIIHLIDTRRKEPCQIPEEVRK